MNGKKHPPSASDYSNEGGILTSQRRLPFLDDCLDLIYGPTYMGEVLREERTPSKWVAKLRSWWARPWQDRVSDVCLGVLDVMVLMVFYLGAYVSVTAIITSMTFSFLVTVITLSKAQAAGELKPTPGLWDSLELLSKFFFLGLLFLSQWLFWRILLDGLAFVKWLNKEPE